MLSLLVAAILECCLHVHHNLRKNNSVHRTETAM